jgi:AcrR family transcriptional regulator
MPKTTTQCLEIKEEREKEILNTALKLFCEHGFAAVSVDDICKKLKISHGLFYHYFKGKNDIQATIIANAEERNAGVKYFVENTNLIGIDYIRKVTSLILDELRKDDMACYYAYYMIMDASLDKEKLKNKPPKAFKRMIKEIKKGQDDHDVIPGDPFEIFFANSTMLLGIASLNMKHQENGKPLVPNDEIVMNLFYRKKDIK